jgi:hypothetical protein
VNLVFAVQYKLKPVFIISFSATVIVQKIIKGKKGKAIPVTGREGP